MLMNKAPDAKASGQRRLLALDGGGIRGVLTLEVLSEFEAMLRKEYNDTTLVLGNYFDYIAGTSTGAMIAAGLALGWPVERIMGIYINRGPDMFETLPLHKRVATLFGHKYSSAKLAQSMREEYGVDTDFGDARFETLLLAVMHNSNTDSPWPLSNNPMAKYNSADRPDCNLRLPLWEVVRASTAAPLAYPPEPVVVGGREFVFVDGAVTPFNNPAFQLYLQATTPEYRLEWPTGTDRMLLVSVGTGLTPNVKPNLTARQMNALHSVRTLAGTLMGGAVLQQDMACRMIGHTIHGSVIDREIGDLSAGADPGERKFSYARYNAMLTIEGLEKLGLGHLTGRRTLAGIRSGVGLEHVEALREIGRAIGQEVSAETFSGFVGVRR